MMEEAQQDAVLGRWSCRRSSCVSRGGLRRRRRAGRTVRPTGSACPEGDGVADPGRDGLGEPDVQRQARPAQPRAELPPPQERRQPARPREQVHGLADDRALQGLPRQGGIRGAAGTAGAAGRRRRCRRAVAAGARAAAAVVAAAGVVAEPVQLDAQPDQSSSAPGLTSPVTNGTIAASHATASAASPSSHAPPPPPLAEARARCPAHCARTRAVHSSSSAELPSSLIRSAREMCTTALTGCPARSGSSPAVTSRRIASCSASWQRCGWLRASSAPAGADSASSTVATIEAHSGVRSPVRTPAPPNVVSSFTDRSSNASSLSLSSSCGEGAGVDLPGQPGQVRHIRAARRRPQQDRVRVFLALLGQLVRPAADGPRDRLRDLPGGQRLRDLGVRGGAADPRGVPDGGALGHVGLVDQPRPRAVIRIRGVPLPGGERRQDRGPRRRPHRAEPAPAPAGTAPGSPRPSRWRRRRLGSQARRAPCPALRWQRSAGYSPGVHLPPGMLAGWSWSPVLVFSYSGRDRNVGHRNLPRFSVRF